MKASASEGWLKVSDIIDAVLVVEGRLALVETLAEKKPHNQEGLWGNGFYGVRLRR